MLKAFQQIDVVPISHVLHRGILGRIVIVQYIATYSLMRRKNSIMNHIHIVLVIRHYPNKSCLTL